MSRGAKPHSPIMTIERGRERPNQGWPNKDVANLISGLGHFAEIAAHVDKYSEGFKHAKKDALIITDDGEYDDALLGD